MVRMEGSLEGASAVWEEGGPGLTHPSSGATHHHYLFLLSLLCPLSLPSSLAGNWALEELSVEGGLAGDLGLVMKVSHVTFM